MIQTKALTFLSGVGIDVDVVGREPVVASRWPLDVRYRPRLDLTPLTFSSVQIVEGASGQYVLFGRSSYDWEDDDEELLAAAPRRPNPPDIVRSSVALAGCHFPARVADIASHHPTKINGIRKSKEEVLTPLTLYACPSRY